MAKIKGSRHTMAVHRAAAELTSPVARSLLFRSTGVVDPLLSLDARTELSEAPSARQKGVLAGFALSRAQERVPTVSETQSIVRLGPEWVEVKRAPARSIELERLGPRLRQIMVERLAAKRSEDLRQLRLLTRFVTPGIFGMTLKCLERKARRESLFARARLEKMEGRGNGRPRPRKRHWRRSWYSLIGC